MDALPHFEGVKRRGGESLGLWNALMHLRERDNQGRPHGASLKDERESFDLPKCVVCPRERGRVHETILEVE